MTYDVAADCRSNGHWLARDAQGALTHCTRPGCDQDGLPETKSPASEDSKVPTAGSVDETIPPRERRVVWADLNDLDAEGRLTTLTQFCPSDIAELQWVWAEDGDGNRLPCIVTRITEHGVVWLQRDRREDI